MLSLKNKGSVMYGAFYKVLSVNASFDARIRLDRLLKNLDLA